MPRLTRGQRIAEIALAHTGCSSTLRPELYQDVVRRPADAAQVFDSLYLHNQACDSCALFVLGVLRLAGLDEPETTASVFPHGGPERVPIADVQSLARRLGAWVTSSPPVPPFRQGDIWIASNARGLEPAAGICLEDAAIGSTPNLDSAVSTWTVQTAEGGHYSGSDASAIGTFTRTWQLVGARWKIGKRFLLGYVSARGLPIETAETL